MKPLGTHAVVRIVVIFALAGSLWIILSDRLLTSLGQTVEQVIALEILKGLLFIAATSILMFILLWREFASRQRMEDDLRDLNNTLESRIQERTHALEEANRRLIELSQAQQRVIRDVSHALKTPLTSINLRLELLERAPVERAPQYIAGIKEQVQVVNTMVNGLLDLSRIEAEVDAPLEPVDLNAAVERSIEAHIGLAQNKGLALVFSPARPLPPVAGRDEQLVTLADNLLSNAIKYTEAGAISITTRYEADQHEAVLIVEDTGSGIPSDEIPHLFKRFYRCAAARKSGIAGSGLGLGIVQEIIEQHNGRVEVWSQPGQGSVFTIRLPIAQESSAAFYAPEIESPFSIVAGL